MKKITLILTLIFNFYSLGILSQNDAEIDLSFNIGSGFEGGTVRTICLQNDGKILVGGYFTTYQGVSANKIIRLNSDGSIDTTFNYGSGFNGASVDIIKIQSDGKILICGNYTTYKNIPCNHTIRLNTNGDFDPTFTLQDLYVYEIEIDNNDNIYIGGGFTTSSGTGFKNLIMKLDQNGNINSSFNNGTLFYNQFGNVSGYVSIIKIQTDGKLIVGGTFQTTNPFLPNFIRLNTDGTIDNSFNSLNGFTNICKDIKIQSDGKIVAVGNFDNYYQNSYNATMHGKCRINDNGTLDSTFGNSINGFDISATTVDIQSNDKIIIGGDFSLYNNLSQRRLIRLNSDGTKDHTFDIGIGFNEAVTKVIIQNDGKILVGGNFTNYKGTSVNRIVRLINTTLSSDEYQTPNISIFPNPVKDVLFLETEENLEYKIYDITGKNILNGFNKHINVSSLDKGVYIIKIANEDKIITKKFIKE